MPPVHTILIESDDPEGPFGAKEVGHGPLLPVIPAVANAIHDALGVRIDEIPITPDKIVTAMRNLARGRTGRVGPTSVPDFEFPDLIRVEPPEEFAAS
jgi:4-hydroxybenzoyl-CoA reductase subunit alpha